MAPKGKAAAKPDAKAEGKAAPAGKGAEGGATKIDPVLLAKNKKIFIACGSAALFFFVLIIMMIGLCIELSGHQKPIDKPFEQLTTTLARAVRKRKDELDTRSLFYMPYARSSSGPWNFHGNSLYYFSKEEKNWYDAEDFCISRGGHLASVHDDEEQNYISFQLQHTSWIGLKAENEEGEWSWSDGSRLVKEYWSEDEPSNRRVFGKSNQDCAIIVPSLTYHNWKDNNCRKLYRWVCKGNLELGE